MKIKDIKGERSFTILKDVIPYIEKFSRNEYFQKVFDKSDLSTSDEEAQKEAVGYRISEYLPDLIASCGSDLAAYFSLLNGTSLEEYMKDIDTEEIMSGIIDMFSDEHFMTFFAPRLKKNFGQV